MIRLNDRNQEAGGDGRARGVLLENKKREREREIHVRIEKKIRKTRKMNETEKTGKVTGRLCCSVGSRCASTTSKTRLTDDQQS